MKINKEIKNKLNILLLILITIIVLYISLKDNFFEVIDGLKKNKHILDNNCPNIYNRILLFKSTITTHIRNEI